MTFSLGEDDERPGSVEKIPAHGIYAGIERYTNVYGEKSNWKYTIDRRRYEDYAGGNPKLHTPWFSLWEEYFDQLKQRKGALYEEEMRLREQRRQKRKEMEEKWKKEETKRRNLIYVTQNESELRNDELRNAELRNADQVLRDKSETPSSDTEEDSITFD